jgi:LAS superfamily LD-carboxypeptidase LdcB
VTRATAFNALTLTGRAADHVVAVPELRLTLHRAVVRPFLALRAAAAREGLDLVAASSFRDFAAQLRIWNEKWLGARVLLDRAGRPLNAAVLAPKRRVDAILIWSAAPGTSRHHWGTDLDVWDRAAVPADYRLQLVPEEYAAGGPFGRLSAWLDRHMGRHGFYRPYVRDRGGVQPEPWHLSHAPTAAEASRRLRLATLYRALEPAEVEGKSALLARLPVVYRRYVRNVERPIIPRPSATAPRGGRASARARSAPGRGRR